MNLINNVKSYFGKKLEKKETGKAPEGICPNCWGSQEWDGEFYKKISSKNVSPNTDAYSHFINEVVRSLDKITLKADTYLCETCNMKFKP
ncbi:hypothetical protein [Pontimicrobium aquaticum]|uniref:Uncharacterized protein n=1 Tax=Pontimicrobium aquaticum TaxID=2565367 RepID=A0A4V5LRC2_9FLAO|nr:hypothetical protein [Pontimicrobium aquaticum]TJY37869.1 hypothetical protein E5167_01020 [Pontimicrobium aquaticum]